MDKVILFPFNGNAREVAAWKLKKIKLAGFIDDNPKLQGSRCCAKAVLGTRDAFTRYPRTYVLAVPGSPDSYRQRKKIIESLGFKPERFTKIIHPSVKMAGDAQVGFNTLIMANAVIGTNVKIGNHVVILPNTVIGHDSVIADYCCLGANVTISGYVSVGAESYIGSGVNVRERISIGRRTLIGLGANVVSDFGDNLVVAGNPARVINTEK